MDRRLYYNANIITMEEERPYANYLVTKGGRIEAVGVASESELLVQYAHQAEMVDLNGRYVIPGFIDSHMHMLTGALTKLQVDLNQRQFQRMEEMMAFVKANAVGDGWIRAFGYDEARVSEKCLLTRADLDRAFPHQPVIVTRVCGHVSTINSAAISCLGEEVLLQTEERGFQRDSNGRLTGIAAETAQQYILDRIPPPDREEILQILETEQRSLLEKGICSIHDGGTDQLPVPEYVELYEEFNRTGRLKIRTYLMVRPVKEMKFADFVNYVKNLIHSHRPEESRLFFGAVKLFADGSIGGRTAAIYSTYQSDPENRGMLLSDGLDCFIRPVHQAGLQLAVHAIGDRAAEYTADQMIAAIESDGNPIRHRIEHGELQNEKIMEKLAKNHLCVMTQPGFMGEFQESYRRNLGEAEAQRIQPLKTMRKRGIHVGFGSDYPVMDPSPAYGIQCALGRREKNGCGVLNPEESIPFCDALRAYTVENAYGSYTEVLQGSLAPGKFADFVILDCGPEKILWEEGNLVVKQTVVGGETLYERGESERRI